MENTMSDFQSIFNTNESFINFCKKNIQFQHLNNVPNISHPDNKTLYRYVNNELEDKDTNAVMNHIAYCERCAKEVSWIMKKNQQMEDKLFRLASSVPFYQNITNSFKKSILRLNDSSSFVDYISYFHWNRHVQLAFVSLLLIISLPLIYVCHIQKTHDIKNVQVKPSSKLKMLIDQHFELLMTDRSTLVAENLLFPWEKKSNFMLFAPANYSETNQKFASGLYSARRLLLNNSRTNDVLTGLQKNISQNDLIFLFGKWCFLMKLFFLSDVELSNKLKNQTIMIIDQFKINIDRNKTILKEDIHYIHKKLSVINQIIKSWPNDKIIERRNRDKISNEFSKLIDHLSPLRT